VTEAELDALEEPEAWPEVFDDRSRLALLLADAVCGDTHTLDPALIAELRNHFGEAELAELILVAGQANLNNRAGNAAKQLLGPAPE
jgi:alkylhydroperoxidase family enzyme